MKTKIKEFLLAESDISNFLKLIICILLSFIVFFFKVLLGVSSLHYNYAVKISYTMLLSSVIVAPIVEEFMFRYHLKASKFGFIGFLIGCYIFIAFLLKNNPVYFVLFSGIFFAFLFFKKGFGKKVILSFLNFNYLIIWFLSCAMYSILHLKLDQGFSLILFLSHFFAGLVFAIARTKFGMQWAIYVHAISNGIILYFQL